LEIGIYPEYSLRIFYCFKLDFLLAFFNFDWNDIVILEFNIESKVDCKFDSFIWRSWSVSQIMLMFNFLLGLIDFKRKFNLIFVFSLLLLLNLFLRFQICSIIVSPKISWVELNCFLGWKNLRWRILLVRRRIPIRIIIYGIVDFLSL
jgi:hypothetical protein